MASFLRRIEYFSPSIFSPNALSLHDDELDLTLDLLNPSPFPPLYPFEISDFDTVTDLIQIQRSPITTTTRRVRRVDSVARHQLQSLSDRVSALELTFDSLAKGHVAKDRKYTWEAEIKHPDRKYKLTAEIKGKKSGKVERDYKWTAEIKDSDDVSRSYTLRASSGSEKKEKKEKEKKKVEKKAGSTTPRVVEIEETMPDHRVVVLRQAFAKRAGALEKCRGKRRELSPQDAAMMIQMTFKAYLVRRSQALRALRELAVAKAKLKELRVLFNNFAYRRRVARDAEERQRFTEKIIVVLLTVDSIEGADVMVRAAKRSMTDELEAMLDVVDPQPAGKSRINKRTFDMPDGIIQKELAAGVAEVVQMLDQENTSNFEACL